MLYSFVGTNAIVRAKGREELKSFGEAHHVLYQEHKDELRQYIDAMSLFGGIQIVHVISFGDQAQSRAILVELLPEMAQASTLFIVDEPFADQTLVKLLTTHSKKLFNAKETEKKEMKVFDLCDAFAKKDKKNAWLIFMSLKEEGESAEAIAGALFWKVKTLWQGALSGKKTSFTKEEFEEIGKALVVAPIEAHRGMTPLYDALEMVILK
jgi:DNA polymerase III delta subunit